MDVHRPLVSRRVGVSRAHVSALQVFELGRDVQSIGRGRHRGRAFPSLEAPSDATLGRDRATARDDGRPRAKTCIKRAKPGIKRAKTCKSVQTVRRDSFATRERATRGDGARAASRRIARSSARASHRSSSSPWKRRARGRARKRRARARATTARKRAQFSCLSAINHNIHHGRGDELRVVN